MDKDLRRNAEHEHNSYLFRCEHCGFEDDIYVGVGWKFYQIYDQIVEKIKNGYYGEKWQALYANNPKAIVNTALTLYVCSSCGHYMSDYNLGLYALKEGLTNEEVKLADQDPESSEMKPVYLYNMMWSIQYYRKLGDYVHRCPACNKRMHIGGYTDKPICPKCGKNGSIGYGRIIWD